MNRSLLFILFCALISTNIFAQQFEKKAGKYFIYSISEEVELMAASPLFADSPHKDSTLLYAGIEEKRIGNWIPFTDNFVHQVLEKHLTVEEIRSLTTIRKQARAQIIFYFDYYGNVFYVTFIFPKEDRDILTEEKLYALYGDILKLKIDVSNFIWYVAGPAYPKPEDYGRLFAELPLPFFYRYE